jgi:hypothetical protein
MARRGQASQPQRAGSGRRPVSERSSTAAPRQGVALGSNQMASLNHVWVGVRAHAAGGRGGGGGGACYGLFYIFGPHRAARGGAGGGEGTPSRWRPGHGATAEEAVRLAYITLDTLVVVYNIL